MLAKFVVIATAGCVFACGTIPVAPPTPLVSGNVYEFGGLYAPAEDLDNINTEVNEKVATTKPENKTGYFGLFQSNGGYVRFDAAPDLGMWVGAVWEVHKSSMMKYAPAVEFTLTGGGSGEKTEDGYLVDSDGNRYLYEIRRSSGGLGVSSSQQLEFFVMDHVFFSMTAMPTWITNNDGATVDMVYERDRRLVEADPDLKEQLDEIKQREEGTSSNRLAMPLILMLRVQYNQFQTRLGYSYRGMDSEKETANVYKQYFTASFGMTL